MPTFHITADPTVLSQDLQGLFSRTDVFCETELGGLNRCLLAAAGSDSLRKYGNDLGPLTGALNDADPEVRRSLVELVHGQEVVLQETQHFFNIFALAEKMKLAACQEICKELVSSGKYNELPIRLQISAQQGMALRQQLWEWRTAQISFLTDAAILVAKPESADDHDDDESDSPGQKIEHIRVHSVLLAASCEYVRCLWAGNFREADGSYELRLDDARDGPAARILVEAIYGNTVAISSVEELLQVCCLADRWQCGAVRSKALQELEPNLDMDAAIDILNQPVPPPDALFRTAVAAMANQMNNSRCHGMDLAALRKMPLAAANRLLRAPSEHEKLLNAARLRVLICLCNTELVMTELTEVEPQAMGTVLALFDHPTSETLAPHVACTGPSAASLKVSFQGHTTSVRHSWNSRFEDATIGVSGPCEIVFDRFDLGSGDMLEVGQQSYVGENCPPKLKIRTGETLQIKWRANNSSALDRFMKGGWQFTASMELPDPSLLLGSILEWVRTCSATGGTVGTVCPLPNASPQLERLIALQHAAGVRRDSDLIELFRGAFAALFEMEGAVVALSLLNAWCNSDHLSHEGVTASFVCTWASKSMCSIVAIPEWLQARPEAVSMLLQECVNSEGPLSWTPYAELPKHLARWGCEGPDPSTKSAIVRISQLCKATTPAMMRAILCNAIVTCFDSEGDATHLVCEAFDAAFSEVPTESDESEARASKRRRTEQGQAKVNRMLTIVGSNEAKALIGEAAHQWMNAANGRFSILSAGAAWLELEPAALVKVAQDVQLAEMACSIDEGGSPLVKEADALAQAISRWVNSAEIATVFEALSFASSHMGNALQALHKATKDRMLTLERENAMHQGSKFRDELVSAVAAAKVETEARLRHEFDDAKAELQREVAAERQKHDEVAKCQDKKLSALKQRVLTALDDTG